MSRAILAACLLSVACGASVAEPVAPARSSTTSGAESGHPPLPAARDATFVQSIHVPLALLASSIQAQIPEHESQPRKLLTRPNASPAIEASIEVWRDDVQVRFEGDTLLVDVPLRYAARFDAKMKNPFGGKWLKVAKNEDWGSERDPQRVTLHVRTRIEITPQWQLHLATDIDQPEHGPAPDGKLCTAGAFKLCITKDSFTSEVRRRLEGEVVPRVRSELEKLDRKIEQTVDLRARVERTWRGLTEPRSLSHDQYSTIMPRLAALNLQPGDAELVVDAAVHGKVTYFQGKPPSVEAPPLADKVSFDALPSERVQDPRVFSIDAAF